MKRFLFMGLMVLGVTYATQTTASSATKTCHYELQYASASTKATYPATETRVVSVNRSCPASWTVSDNGWSPTGVYIFVGTSS